MAEELVLYTNPMSRGRIVRWMLEEVGQPYQARSLDYAKLKDPAYLAINPMGKVPALVHGSTLVTEAAAICAYLADAFPQAGLAPPPGDPARGPYYRWLFFVAGPLEAATTNKVLGVEVKPEQQKMAGYGAYGYVMDALEQAVDGREHLAGGRFSAADLYVGSHLDWGMGFGTVEKRPAFQAYVARLRERPAFKRAAEIDDALIAAQQSA
jgi:glutathione S-transferase